MKQLKSFARFWYEFIIGDDPKIALAVVLALGLLLAALKTDLFSDHVLAVLGGAAVVVFFAISLAIDVRPSRPRRPR